MSRVDVSSLVTIYSCNTGQALQRRAVDARELVNSGQFSFEQPQKNAYVPPIEPVAEAAVLTEQSSKEDMIAALTSHGIQFRANMSKADLFNLWNESALHQDESKA